MKKTFIVLFLSLQFLYSFAQINNTHVTDMVVKNVSVISMTSEKIKQNQDVVIKNGKVSSISNSKKTNYKNLLIIDGTGKYMMPSLGDAHVHFPETEAEMERVMELYIINGVTKLRSMRGDWKHIDWRQNYNSDTSVYPKLYLSPPAISRQYDFSLMEISDYVKVASDQGFDFLKILSVKDPITFSRFDSISKSYNFPISGHFPSNIPDSLIFQSNYNSFEHLGGLADNPDALKSRLQLIKERNLFISPTLTWYSIGSGRYSYDELRQLPGMEFVSQATVEEWIKKTTQYREKIGMEAYKEEVANELNNLNEKFKIIKELNALGIPMLLSPDSSSNYMISGFDMVYEMELLKNADLSNYEILRMATVNFATFFKEDYGTIEIGKAADFLLLNNNPLEDLDALKKIDGLYYNSQFLDSKKLEAIRMKLLAAAQN